jgi:fructose-bisphosphate aldolase, class I
VAYLTWPSAPGMPLVPACWREAGQPGKAVQMNDVASAAALVAPGKGILAADESITTMSSRLAAAGVAPTAKNRRAYREMIVTTPGLASGISGVILCDETLRQRLRDGRHFPDALADLGMMTGVKVHAGGKPLAGTRDETITEGLDGLLPRLREYAELGAQFAKWRAVLRIGPGMPSLLAVRANAQALGRYAAACQDAGLVPIVEPEVLMDGAHSLAHCETVTSVVLLEVMNNLHEYGVAFEDVVLKPNMVLPGSASGADPSPAEVAEATLGSLNGVPMTLAGVAFLSGGQRPQRATENLAAMQHTRHLWPLTFCFGRALAASALAAWRGEPGRWEAGQCALARRVSMNVAAVEGRYTRDLELGLDGAYIPRLDRVGYG